MYWSFAKTFAPAHYPSLTLLSQPTNTALEDPRFHELFTNPEYQVDKDDEEFKKLHPNASVSKLGHMCRYHLLNGRC